MTETIVFSGPASDAYGVICGRVLVAGTDRPAAGSGIELRRGDRSFARATADHDGRFIFSRVPHGDYRLRVRPPAGTSRLRAPDDAIVVSANAVERATVELTTYAVEGAVTVEQRPVVGASVRLAGGEERTWTDDQGKYRLAGVEPGPRTLVVAHGTHPSVTRDIIITEAGPTIANVELIA